MRHPERGTRSAKRVGAGPEADETTTRGRADIPGRYHPGEVKKGKVTKLTNFRRVRRAGAGPGGPPAHLRAVRSQGRKAQRGSRQGRRRGSRSRCCGVDAADRKIGLSRKTPARAGRGGRGGEGSGFGRSVQGGRRPAANRASCVGGHRRHRGSALLHAGSPVRRRRSDAQGSYPQVLKRPTKPPFVGLCMRDLRWGVAPRVVPVCSASAGRAGCASRAF